MKCQKMNDFFSAYGGFLTRIVVGVIFLLAGISKLFGTAPGIEGFSGMLANIGLPIPVVLAIIVGVVELVGGAFLILGIFTRCSAKLLAAIMLVAIITVHLKAPASGTLWSGLRYPLLLFVILLTYVGQHPGKCSMHSAFCKKPKRNHPIVEERPVATTKVTRKAPVKKKVAKKTTKKKATTKRR